MKPLLETIDFPAQLRQLDRKQLPQLADELREFLNLTLDHSAT